MSVVLCSSPEKITGEDGSGWYCRYCKFVSGNIEDFAIGMCWNCVYNEEPVNEEINQGGNMHIGDIKPGQLILVSKEVIVSSVSQGDGLLYPVGGNGAKIRVAKPSYDRYTDFFVYDTKLIKDKETTTPEHWPVQAGDVWRDDAGKEYHVLATPYGSAQIYNADTTYSIEASNLKVKSGIKLVYRKGNAVK